MQKKIKHIKKETNESITRFFGTELKLQSINNKIWDIIFLKDDRNFELTDFEKIECTESEILTLLGILNNLKYLELIYTDMKTNRIVPIPEWIAKLKAWHKDKTLSEEEWKEWASNVHVEWKLHERFTL